MEEDPTVFPTAASGTSASGTSSGDATSSRTNGDAPGTEDLTIVITTSPIPSMPSTALLQTCLSSLDNVGKCPIIIVCDAIGQVRDDPPNWKKGQVRPHHVKAYSEYVDNVRTIADAQQRPCQLLSLSTWHGCALALQAALKLVSTRFVMLVQHDQIFLRDFDVRGVLGAMRAQPEVIRYVGIPSRTTLRYRARAAERFGLDLPALSLPEHLREPLLPLLMWFDKPHITSCAHLQHLYATTRGLVPGCFLEDVIGRPQLEEIKALGLGAHAKHGTWVVEEDSRPVTYHLSGRKVQAEDRASRIRAEGDAGVRSVTAMPAMHDGPVWAEATTSIYAAAPGLAPPPCAAPCAPPPSSRFRGVCYRCQAKGHSFRFCPLALASEAGGDATARNPQVVQVA